MKQVQKKDQFCLLKLSPNEQLEYQRQKEAEYRKNRVLALRQFERERSKEQRLKFEFEYRQALNYLLKQVETEWENYKDFKLASLEAALDQSMQMIGQGFENAQKLTQKETENMRQLKRKILNDFIKEKQRSSIAAHQIYKEDRERQQEKETARINLESVRQNEKQRALNIARMYRMTHPEDILNQNIEPLETTRHVQFQHRSNAPHIQRYDDTYYNQNYAAIRTQTDFPSAAALPNAIDMAKVVKEEIDKQDRKKEQMKEYHSCRANERYDTAIKAVKMEKEKEEMIMELEKIQVADRQRKQILVDASQARISDNETQRQLILRKFFEKKFENLDEKVISSRVVSTMEHSQ